VTSPLEQCTPQNIFSVDEAVLFSVQTNGSFQFILRCVTSGVTVIQCDSQNAMVQMKAA